MNVKHLLAASALASLSATAGMFDKPWALVEPGDNSEVRKEAPVAITKVDGVSTRNPRESDPIPPGDRKITVRYETARGVVTDNSRELDMKLEPCTRYRVVAEYKVKTGPEWEPKAYPEPIGECRKKFGLP
jgi:hypothetical protein